MDAVGSVKCPRPKSVRVEMYENLRFYFPGAKPRYLVNISSFFPHFSGRTQLLNF